MATTTTSAILIWARREARNHWRTWLALAALVGLAGGLASAAVAGARRTDTAYARFREATGRSDVILFPTQAGLFLDDLSALRDLPGVEAAGAFHLAPIGLKEHPSVTSLPGDHELYVTISRPLVSEGRLPSQDRPDEILLNRPAAELTGLSIGDTVTVISSNDLDAFFASSKLEGGPTVVVTVVGIGKSNMELAFAPDEPGFIPSPSFLSTYREIPRVANLVVRLAPGADPHDLRVRAAEALGVPDMPMRDLAEDVKRITHATDLEQAALGLFAVVVGIAAVVLLGQALTRATYSMAGAVLALRAIGFTRAQLVAGMMFPAAAVSVAGAAISIAVAVALSPRFPVGLARSIEPDLGFHLDAAVVFAGSAVAMVLVLVGGVYAAMRATRRTSDRIERPGLLAALLPPSPLLPVAIGARLALQRGTGERRLPVRPAIVSAIVGVAGIVGSFGLVEGIDDALAEPARSGQVWHAEAYPNEQHPSERIVDIARKDEDVTVVAIQRRTYLEVSASGIPVHSLRPIDGAAGFTVIEGKPPRAADEIALGPASARAMNKGIGDTVTVGNDARARVVGYALLPQTPHTSFDQGAWMTADALDAVAQKREPFDTTVVMRFAPTADEAVGVARLRQKLGPRTSVERRSLPQDVEYLRNVRGLPRALAAFMAVLALGAIAHALVSVVRRRRHDLAVLRAIGFRPRQVAGCVLWQAIVVAAAALIVGIPAGLSTGRYSWRWVAEVTPLLYVAPAVLPVLAVLVPAALVASQGIAAVPARRAHRLAPAEVLRAE